MIIKSIAVDAARLDDVLDRNLVQRLFIQQRNERFFDFSIGNPSFPPPGRVKDAIISPPYLQSSIQIIAQILTIYKINQVL